jgi:hypothetical protein
VRLIDADALNVAEEVGAVCKRMGLPEKSIFEAFVTGWLEGAIDGSPTIDAVPVVRGEWIRMDETQALLSVDWKCSLCEQEIRVDGILTAIGAGWNFCPNCGADNRGSEVT